MTKKSNRRTFLKEVSLATAVTAIPSVFSPVQLNAFTAPSDRLRMGCIGLGSMGRGDAAQFNKIVDIIALCDIDTTMLGRAENLKLGPNISGKRRTPETSTDYRRILDRKDIDVVSIVTPDHWHVKIAIEALQAGKHVFCQKPLTLTLEENQLIRRACEKYGKVFQVGTQQRSQRDQFMTATLMVRSGMLGRIKRVTCDIGGSPTSGDIPKAEVPASLDWNTWLGQAPYTEFLAQDTSYRPHHMPFAQTRCHYEFRWWYEYSGGKFTDWGAHHVDCALWALNLQELGTGPVSVNGTDAEHPVLFKDGYPTVSNRYNTAHKFNIIANFADGLEMVITSGSPDGNGILFEGTQGRIHVNRQRIKGGVYQNMPADTFKPEDFMTLYNGKPYESHKKNFIRCIREGGKPVSDVATHVLAMNLCHLCGISARLKRIIKWDPLKEIITGDEQAATFFAREQRKGFEIPKIE